MARLSRIADSNESEIDAGESPNVENVNITMPELEQEPKSELSHQVGELIENKTETIQANGADEDADEGLDEEDAENTIVVMVPGPKNPDEYVPYQEDDTVYSVLEELTGSNGEVLYRVEYEDERQEKVSENFSSSNNCPAFERYCGSHPTILAASIGVFGLACAALALRLTSHPFEALDRLLKG